MKFISFFTIFVASCSALKVQVPSRGVRSTSKEILPMVRRLPSGLSNQVWDPLRLTDNMDNALVKYMREAEQQHGRIAMLSMAILPTLDIFDAQDLAIDAYNSHTDLFSAQTLFVGMMFVEISRLLVLYKAPWVKPFRLKDDAYPGNLFQFDAQNVNMSAISQELNVGRVAMLSSLFLIVDELVTNAKIIH